MRVWFGKYKGKSVEELVLKHADYIMWVLQEPDPGPYLKWLSAEILRLIEIFDNKPILGRCHTSRCKRQPTKVTAAAGQCRTLYPWCRSCDPYGAGAAHGKLTEIMTYGDALHHIEWNYGGTKTGYRAIIKAFAVRKGLPTRSGKMQIRAFFGNPDHQD